MVANVGEYTCYSKHAAITIIHYVKDIACDIQNQTAYLDQGHRRLWHIHHRASEATESRLLDAEWMRGFVRERTVWWPEHSSIQLKLIKCCSEKFRNLAPILAATEASLIGKIYSVLEVRWSMEVNLWKPMKVQDMQRLGRAERMMARHVTSN